MLRGEPRHRTQRVEIFARENQARRRVVILLWQTRACCGKYPALVFPRSMKTNPRSTFHRLTTFLVLAVAVTLAANPVRAQSSDAPAAAEQEAVSTTGGKTPPPDINGNRMVIAPPASPGTVRIAIFEGKGAPGSGIENVCARVESMPGSEIRRLKPEEIAAGGLKDYDVVVFSGGSASTQAVSLGEEGREKVREFVRDGGGYVGICAGAYLACSNFTWGLGILNASTVSSKWRRGGGYVEQEITVDGAPILGPVDGVFQVRYNNGPIIKPGSRADLPAYKPLALFRTEVAEHGSPAGIMVNSPAQAASVYGRGRVFISSPHPENTPGLENLIPRAILWSAGKLEETPSQPVP
jgi:putative intracellular protease/amidase